MEEQKITYKDNILLKKLTKGKYAWEIRISRDNLEEGIEELKKLNEKMILKFKGGNKKV